MQRRARHARAPYLIRVRALHVCESRVYIYGGWYGRRLTFMLPSDSVRAGLLRVNELPACQFSHTLTDHAAVPYAVWHAAQGALLLGALTARIACSLPSPLPSKPSSSRSQASLMVDILCGFPDTSNKGCALTFACGRETSMHWKGCILRARLCSSKYCM